MITNKCYTLITLLYDGKTLIYPSQVQTANEVFAPSDEEVEHARRMIACWEEASKKKDFTGVAVLVGSGMIEVNFTPRVQELCWVGLKTLLRWATIDDYNIPNVVENMYLIKPITIHPLLHLSSVAGLHFCFCHFVCHRHDYLDYERICNSHRKDTPQPEMHNICYAPFYPTFPSD